MLLCSSCISLLDVVGVGGLGGCLALRPVKVTVCPNMKEDRRRSSMQRHVKNTDQIIPYIVHAVKTS